MRRRPAEPTAAATADVVTGEAISKLEVQLATLNDHAVDGLEELKLAMQGAEEEKRLSEVSWGHSWTGTSTPG